MSDTAIVSAVAAFVTLVAAGIAYGQWQTAKWKLAADLFPLRHEAYLKIMDAFEFWYRQGPMTPERSDKIESALSSARFLFGKDVRKRFDEVRVEVTNLVNTEYMIYQYEDALEKGLQIDELTEDKNNSRWDEVQRITTFLYEFYIDEELFIPYLALDYRNPSRRNLRLWRRRPKASDEDQEG